MKGSINIALADDHVIVRQAIASLLEREGRGKLKIVAEGSDGAQLIENMKGKKVDVAILDYQMPGLNGRDTTILLKKKYKEIKIIGLTVFHENTVVMDMVEAGANGFLLKKNTSDSLLEAIHSVKKNGYYFNEHISENMIQELSVNKTKFKSLFTPPVFTPKEIKIIQLICQQKTNAEIADLLHVSKRTIEGHRENILAKIGVKNTVGLALYAVENKLV